MIILYGFSKVAEPAIGHTRDLRAQWALEETGLSYRVQGLDFCAGELDTEAYGKLSPFRQIPAIVDGDVVVAESAAVLLYLAEKAGKLIPDDLAGRTAVTQWCFAAMNTVEPTTLMIAQLDVNGAKDAASVKRREGLVKQADRWFTGLERRLDGRSYLATSEFTVADLLMAHVLRETRKSKLLGNYPTVASYVARCEDRPAWKRTCAAYEQRLGMAPGSMS
ncbi:MAG: glutathione S-transferase family protein [Kofleriaceae bacterium]